MGVVYTNSALNGSKPMVVSIQIDASGNARKVVLAIPVEDTNPFPITATFDPTGVNVAMTEISDGRLSNAAGQHVSFFYIDEASLPASAGTYNISCTWNGVNNRTLLSVISCNDMATGDRRSANQSSATAASSITTTITSVSTDTVFGGCNVTDPAAAQTVGTGQTSIAVDSAGPSSSYSTGNTSHSWTDPDTGSWSWFLAVTAWEAASTGTTGTGAGVLSAITASSSGTYTAPSITGSASGILSGIIGSAAGTYTHLPITGTADCTVSAIAGSATGTFTAFAISGTAAGILSSITAAASGTSTPLAINGTGDAMLSALTASASGAVTSLGISGSGSGLLEVVVSSASGTFTPLAITGSADAVLSAITADVTGSYSNADFFGSGSGSLAAVNATALGVLSSSGVANGLLSAITGDSSGAVVNNAVGVAQGVLSSIVADGLGNIPITLIVSPDNVIRVPYSNRTISVRNEDRKLTIKR